MAHGDYIDPATGAMMTSRPITSLPAAVGGAKCQPQMAAQFSQQVSTMASQIECCILSVVGSTGGTDLGFEPLICGM